MEVRQCLTVGSSSRCDFVIADDPHVSPQHCMFSQLRGETAVYLEDLGSTNGTHASRTGSSPHIRVTGRILVVPGMIVRVGRTRLTVPDWLSQSASKSPHAHRPSDDGPFSAQDFKEAAEAAKRFMDNIQNHRWP